MASDPPELVARASLVYLLISLAAAVVGLALAVAIAVQGDSLGAALMAAFAAGCLAFAVSFRFRRRRAHEELMAPDP